MDKVIINKYTIKTKSKQKNAGKEKGRENKQINHKKQKRR
jgi:hypothetical protein